MNSSRITSIFIIGAILAVALLQILSPPHQTNAQVVTAARASIYNANITSLVVLSSSPKVVSAWMVSNTLASAVNCSLDLFDTSTTGSVTLGTTRPSASIPLVANGTDAIMPTPLVFSGGIVAAAVTSPGGNTGCAVGMSVEMWP
jgi:hypothetical protein